MRARRGRWLVPWVALLAAVTACTAAEPPATEDRPVAGCGPPTRDDVGGTAPAYLRGALDRFPNDESMCAARWLPHTDSEFVPQGLVVRGRTAWVSGYDHGAVGHKYCRVLRIDLRDGERVTQRARVGGQVGHRDPVGCRHGGGLSRDEHGLWLTEKRRLWLLDPDTLATKRAWAIVLPVWGSTVLHDARGRLGLVGWSDHRRARLHWYDPQDLLADGVIEVRRGAAAGRRWVPPRTQGAFWGAPAGGEPRVWFVRSTTRCGELKAGQRRRGFIPGAEGTALGEEHLWVLSESTSAPYWRRGGRPLVPQLARFEVADLADWRPPDCTV
ncbi:hypothetical protein KUV85_16135 [Nocardioides panacisoli]|uniref:hypothetical protein n=1 Tax=Nocardioides panacisoli TaxID=627624 RepID=UPI001C625928|nr:hypothetical protein [Nocardioides panacisoli]QYJ03832.1 hypothetical protein KUV85_16135 [Nocardioides panacisoli]